MTSCVVAYVCDEWEVSRDNVTVLKPLGQGSFGMVYEGILHDASSGRVDVHVAVKVGNGSCITKPVYIKCLT